MAGKIIYSRDDREPTPTLVEADKIRQVVQRFPRPLRFLAIGALGLTSDITFFTLIASFGAHSMVARALSLGIATLVTWRLNRHLTFDHSGRNQSSEAIRYVAVTATAQGASYAIFAVLVLSVMSSLPQLAIIIGAAVATLISYNGHRLIAFAPQKASARGSHS